VGKGLPVMLVMSQRKTGRPVVLPEPASRTETWPEPTTLAGGIGNTASAIHQTMSAGVAFSDELISAGPLSQYTFDKVNETISHWQSIAQNGHNSFVAAPVDARDFFSVIGEVHDGNYIDQGGTQESTARRLLDTWADYSAFYNNQLPGVISLRAWAQGENVWVAPWFI